MIGIPKPERQARTKAREKRHYTKARAACRKAVYERAGGCCELCGMWLLLDHRDAFTVFQIAHIDEIVSRAHGGDPCDESNCRLLCQACHFSGPSGAHRSRHLKVGA